MFLTAIVEQKIFKFLKYVGTSVLSFCTQCKKSKTSWETLFWRDASPDPGSEEFHVVQIGLCKKSLWTVLSLANMILNFKFFNLNSTKHLMICLIISTSVFQNLAFLCSPGVCYSYNKEWEEIMKHFFSRAYTMEIWDYSSSLNSTIRLADWLIWHKGERGPVCCEHRKAWILFYLFFFSNCCSELCWSQNITLTSSDQRLHWI